MEVVHEGNDTEGNHYENNIGSDCDRTFNNTIMSNRKQ